MYSNQGERKMPTHARFATRAAEEALDVQFALDNLRRVILDAIHDGKVELAEANAVLAALRTAEVQARESVTIAEQADVSQLIAAAGLTGVYSPALLKRAKEVGLNPILLSAATRRQDDDNRAA